MMKPEIRYNNDYEETSESYTAQLNVTENNFYAGFELSAIGSGVDKLTALRNIQKAIETIKVNLKGYEEVVTQDTYDVLRENDMVHDWDKSAEIE